MSQDRAEINRRHYEKKKAKRQQVGSFTYHEYILNHVDNLRTESNARHAEIRKLADPDDKETTIQDFIRNQKHRSRW